jgi:predicted Zn-dependent protease
MQARCLLKQKQLKAMFKSAFGIAVVCIAALTACQSVQTTQGGTVGVSRKQLMAVSREEVDQQSALAYSQMRQEASQKRVLNTDPAVLARVQGIANRLIPHAAVFRPDAPNWKWEVNVFQSNEVNAFCMAGGKIAVYTGLISQLKITDDELAAVMGHEIAHALREHVREQMSEQQTLGIGALIGSAVLGVDPRLAQDATQVLIGLPHSRRAEVEADDIGLELAARAGYNPKAAITLWQKMGSLGGGRPPTFLSTHPSPESRASDLARVAQIVQPLYDAAPKPVSAPAVKR